MTVRHDLPRPTPAPSAAPAPVLIWDIFCRVIDNLGDIGVCWRLSVNLAYRGQRVRLWTDDASALAWMAPGGAEGVEVLPWREPFDACGQTPGDVLVEAFGCEVAPEFIAMYASTTWASGKNCHWINLEYLSAQTYVERCHGLPSPVMDGPGRGRVKRFYYPGFGPRTGGLLREPDLMARRARFDRQAWLAGHGVPWQGERLVALFCYEPAGLPALLRELAHADQPSRLLVAHGRASTALRCTLELENSLHPFLQKGEKLHFSYLPPLTQADFDHLLWASDLNCVRGEDSLVRALWAGQALLWHIYPQGDNAHHAKLQAFLDWLQAPPTLRQAMACWNGLAPAHGLRLDDERLSAWGQSVWRARQTLLDQPDLAQQLLGFVAKAA